MTTRLNQLLSLLGPLRREYLILDRDFKILEISLGVQRFADAPDEVVVGKDIRLSFPELIGVEDTLMDILQEQQEGFELNAIGRFSDPNNPLYVDFHIIKNNFVIYDQEQSSENQLIIFFEDVTTRMVLEQSLVQSTNETSLLFSSLSASKAYIDKIVDSMADALLVTSPSGTIKTVNHSVQNLFGYRESELIGQPISLLIKDANLLIANNQQHLLCDPSFNHLEVVCLTKTGEKVTIAFSCSVIQTETEGVENFIYIGRDITERQRNQKRLAAQHATTRIISESRTIADALPKIIPAIAETLAWDLGELWIPEIEGDKSQYIANLQSAISNPQLRCVETWITPSIAIPELVDLTQKKTLVGDVGFPGRIWATRSPQWIGDLTQEVNIDRDPIFAIAGIHGAFGFPLQDDGEILGVMAFYSTDVQRYDPELLEVMAAIGSQLGQFIKRKQAEAALLESEERYRDLFENASDLIQSVTADGKFMYVNRAWRETLGYSQEEIASMSAFDIIHPDCKVHSLQLLQRVMSGDKIDQAKVEFLTKDSRKISLEGSINCKFVEGKPVATRAILRDITERLLSEAALRQEQEKSEQLILNILPSPIANRLKQDHRIIADDFAEVTVLFADIVGFTQLSSSISPILLLDLLNQIFTAFDRLCEQHGLEKIKTIGDAYMVVGGLPNPDPNHVNAIAKMALDMQSTIPQFCDHTGKVFNIRIGINTGPVVAGVIGLKKFSYDLWGDTVNIASRMESQGVPGRIQVTAATYARLRDQYCFEERGSIDVKGKGKMITYFLVGPKELEVGGKG